MFTQLEATEHGSPGSDHVGHESAVTVAVLGGDDNTPTYGRMGCQCGRYLVELDPKHYKLLDDFEAHFPAGPPSLIDAKRLRVQGDVTFGRDVVVRGEVDVVADEPRRIADGTVLDG